MENEKGHLLAEVPFFKDLLSLRLEVDNLQGGEVEVVVARGVPSVAHLVLHAAGGELLHAAVAKKHVTGILMQVGAPSVWRGRRNGNRVHILEGPLLVVAVSSGHIQLMGGVGQISITTEHALGLFFAGRNSEEIAAGGKHAGAFGAGILRAVRREGPRIRGQRRAFIARALDDLGCAQFVRDASEENDHSVRHSSLVVGSWRRNTAGGGINLPRVLAVVVNSESTKAEAHVLQVVNTIDTLCAGLGLGQCRQQHTCENRDDRDDDEQLDQRECANPVFTETIHNFK